MCSPRSESAARQPRRVWRSMVTNARSSGRSSPRRPPCQEKTARSRRWVVDGWATVEACAAPLENGGWAAASPVRGAEGDGGGGGAQPVARVVGVRGRRRHSLDQRLGEPDERLLQELRAGAPVERGAA